VSVEQEIVVLSDLHMGARRAGLDAPDPFADDEALSGLLHHLAGRPAQQGRSLRVILLGDIVDFVLVGVGEAPYDRSARAARRDLEAIAAAHPAVFAALGRLAATACVEVDVVPGNHDMELALPGVAAHLGSLAAAAAQRPDARAALRVAPWLVHVPGVLHAEHGQQHHDLNRFVDLAAVAAGLDDYLRRLPPAAHVDALLAARAAGVGARSVAGTLAGAVPRLLMSAWTMGRARRHAPLPLPEPCAGALSPALLHELERASAVGPAAPARRLARQALARSTRRAALDLRPAALGTHAVLTRHGRPVPYVVFGHTHAPLDEPLCADARHLNAGTWSVMGPGAGARMVVRIVAGGRGEAARAQLERWDAERHVLVAA